MEEDKGLKDSDLEEDWGPKDSDLEEDRGLKDSDLEDGLVRGLRARDSRTSRCSASICLSYSAHMLHIISIFEYNKHISFHFISFHIISIFHYRQSRTQLPPEDVIEAQFLASRPWRRL